MRLTKDEARILGEAMEEYKYKVVMPCNGSYKELGVFNKLHDLQYKLEMFGDDKRRYGRTSQDDLYDLFVKDSQTKIDYNQMKNKISDLRNHLFVVLEELSDPDSKYDLEKAKVIANVAQTIINSASVENQYLKIVGGSQGSGFIEEGKMENIKTLNEKN
jgi:hypothetical protein